MPGRPASGLPCVWALIDDESPEIVLNFFVAGTGAEVLDGNKHVASTVVNAFAWHLFQEVEDTNEDQ